MLRESDYRNAALAIIQLIEKAEGKQRAEYMTAGEALAVNWQEAAERQAGDIAIQNLGIWQKLVTISQADGKSA